MTTFEIKKEFDTALVAPHSNTSSNNQSCFSDEENFNGDENMDNLTMSAKSKLKRKRISEVTYTAEVAFDNLSMATQYVDSLGLWKFERNRPTQKGTKGFYHCKMSKFCKAKIYLLLDSFSLKVVLYQNSLEHNHNHPIETLGPINEVLHAAKRTCFDTTRTETHLDENQTVDIVNENDYEDSLVDFNPNENGDGEEEEEFSNHATSWYDNTINDTINKSLNNTMSRTEHNYTFEKTFNTRAEADQYLESVYPGVWKFERNRPTKKGSKGFFHCKITRKCKAKIYLLSETNHNQIALFRNNIEHNHDSNGVMMICDSSMHQFGEAKSNEANSFENDEHNDTGLDPDKLDEDENHPIENVSNGVMSKCVSRRSNAGTRNEVAYTAEETFENRQLAENFISSLGIWRFHRTRDSKIGAKRFYICRLSKNCKSKIYALPCPLTGKTTVFRNNMEHDHTNTTERMSDILVNEFYDSSSSNNIESGFASVESLVPTKELGENSFLCDTDTEYDNEDTPSPTSSSNTFEAKSLPSGINLESYFTPVQKFDNAKSASKYIESMGLWKFVRTRASKHGSRNFYNCIASQTCKGVCYLLCQPNFSQFILFKNNVEHDHKDEETKSDCHKELQESHTTEDIGPLKYFINTNNNQNFDENDEEFNTNEYESDNSNSNNLNGPDNNSNANSHSENESNKQAAQHIGMPSKSISKFIRKDSINHFKHLKQNENLTKKVEYLEKLNKTLQNELNKERCTKQILLSRLEEANDTIERLKLPEDSKLSLKDTLIKEQEVAIERMQKRIDELLAE